MNLGETRIGEQRASFISAIRCSDVASARVSREIENVSITSGGKHNRVPGEPLNFASAQAAGDDAFGMSIHQHQVEHFGLRKHLDRAGLDLAAKRLVTTKQQLLSSLTPGVECAGNLGASERSIRQ